MIGAIVVISNTGSIDRMLLQLHMNRPGAFAIYVLVWGLTLAALVAVAAERRTPVRLFWAMLIAASGAVAWGYQKVSQVELTVFDGLSLWEARHEAGNAAAQYGSSIVLGMLLFAATVVVMMIPVRIKSYRFSSLMCVLPAVPIALIAGIVYVKAGAGSFGMPKQFSQLSIAGLVAYKQLSQPTPKHEDVVWVPASGQQVKKIVLLVDESIRADYLDLTGEEMPGFANAMKQFVNFGPAASGGVCSNYSNTLLRFAAGRSELGPKLGAMPTLWQYARKAGYRTVYIDAQASNVTNLAGLQNFMTPAEAEQIEKFYAIKSVADDEADFELARIIRKELASSTPVFIYANKRGAHVPYSKNYPAGHTPYRVNGASAGKDTFETRIASYRNAIDWNVDRFFAALWPGLETSDSAIVYTSDHSQYLNPEGLTHCVSANPNQRMAFVPLFAFSSVASVAEGLKHGASQSQGRASHFMIAPSLLSWMGYGKADVFGRYQESLTTGTPYAPAFTAGDIFGLFGNAPLWSSINLGAELRSTELTAAVADAPQTSFDIPPDNQVAGSQSACAQGAEQARGACAGARPVVQ